MSARAPLLLIAAALGSVAAACSGGAEAPLERAPAAYVPDAKCAECHTAAWNEWRGSQHDLAMQEPTEETVLGDFDDAHFEQGALTARFFRRDGAFLVETQGPDGELAEFEVRYVFGVEPLQQYLIEFPGGRVQCLTIAWDTHLETWFSLYPDEVFAPDDPLHWTGRYQRWNAMCAECHSTNLQKGYDEATDSYHTTWSAIDVGCQACHGPGSQHLEWAADPHRELDATRGLEVQLARGAPRGQLNVCAPCHSRRSKLTESPVTGAEFLDGYMPERLREGLYFPDGQIRDEVYVYGSFLQSRMHANGVGCTDCHAPHGLDLLTAGNSLCTQCHSEFAPLDRFPTLRVKNYDSPRHHFHERDSPGASCVACHMRQRTYMVVDPRRDHSFRVPRPDLTVKLGVPNACNDCHTAEGEDAAWAAARIEEWYGSERTSLPHFSEAFARAADGDRTVGPELAGIASDRERPAIVRATALDLLRDFGNAGLEAVRGALDDPDPLVRSAGVRALEVLPPDRRRAGLPMLSDPVRAVRVEAARVLAALPDADLEPTQREARAAAAEEFLAAQAASADMPGAHLNVALFREEQGDTAAAAAAYRLAIEQDPWFLPARFNLVNLLNRTGDNAGAEQLLREGIERVPQEGELHYSLGLLLAEEDRMEEAAESLLTAARLLPDRSRVQYNAGLALERIGREAEAETLLTDAALLAPDDPSPRHALVVFCLRRGDDARALEHARVLTGLIPDSPQAPILLERIRASLGSEAQHE